MVSTSDKVAVGGLAALAIGLYVFRDKISDFFTGGLTSAAQSIQQSVEGLTQSIAQGGQATQQAIDTGLLNLGEFVVNTIGQQNRVTQQALDEFSKKFPGSGEYVLDPDYPGGIRPTSPTEPPGEDPNMSFFKFRTPVQQEILARLVGGKARLEQLKNLSPNQLARIYTPSQLALLEQAMGYSSFDAITLDPMFASVLLPAFGISYGAGGRTPSEQAIEEAERRAAQNAVQPSSAAQRAVQDTQRTIYEGPSQVGYPANIEIGPGVISGGRAEGSTFVYGTILQPQIKDMSLGQIITFYKREYGLDIGATEAADIKAQAQGVTIPGGFGSNTGSGLGSIASQLSGGRVVVGGATPQSEARRAACVTCQMFGLNCPICRGEVGV